MELSFKVKAVYDGRRLGDVLTEQELMSTRQKKQVRLYGSALRNGQPHRLIDPVYAGDEITVSDGESPGEVKSGHRFSVLYEDQYFIAVNKPAGLLTHPSIRDDESVLDTLGPSLRAVGRLDKGTSGVLLLAKDAHSHFVASTMPSRKLYLGICHGRFQEKRVTLEGPIRRSNQQYIRRVVHPTGKKARTRVLMLGYDETRHISLAAFRLETGRTHQIRVHTLWNGNPLVGDWLYGLQNLEDIFPGKGLVKEDRAAYAASLYTEKAFRTDDLIGRAALHAYALTFYHPLTHRYQRVVAPLPSDLKRLCGSISRDAPRRSEESL
ncbi:MAG TPA: RluA family pseudouridine synthase [Fastidiosipila sp.]|nr:RluA family pseudouridine synthase [Fastidiosipila sp.]